MMNSVKELLDGLTPEIYNNLKQSVELGKWPNGAPLTSEQRSLCMQAMIAYEKKNIVPEEHSGFIPPQKHEHCGSEIGDIANDDEQPLSFKH